MDHRTDRRRVLGLGAAGEGAHHWWAQKISALALIPLTILFLWTVLPLIGGGREEVVAAYGRPVNAISSILFIMVLFQHLRQGLQVVMEDYVHGSAALAVLSAGVTLFCWTFAATGVFAVARMAFAG